MVKESFITFSITCDFLSGPDMEATCNRFSSSCQTCIDEGVGSL